jgi:hypothetical protein
MDGINEQHYLQTLGPEGLSQILTGQVSTFSGLGNNSFGQKKFFSYRFVWKVWQFFLLHA